MCCSCYGIVPSPDAPASAPGFDSSCTVCVRTVHPVKAVMYPCTHIPMYPSTHEQPWTRTLTVGLISTEVTRRAVLDLPSDAQTPSQAKPARAVGRSLAGLANGSDLNGFMPASKAVNGPIIGVGGSRDCASAVSRVRRCPQSGEESKQVNPSEPSERPQT